MHYVFNWKLILSGEYFDWLVQGFVVTLQISALSLIIALILGTVIAVLRLSHVRPLVWISALYTEFFRNTPLLVQILFWYFGSDAILPEFVKNWLYQQNIEFAAGVIALSIYTASVFYNPCATLSFLRHSASLCRPSFPNRLTFSRIRRCAWLSVWPN